MHSRSPDPAGSRISSLESLVTGQEARVSSILVLKQLRASLVTFAETAALALEEAARTFSAPGAGWRRTDIGTGAPRSRRAPNDSPRPTWP